MRAALLRCLTFDWRCVCARVIAHDQTMSRQLSVLASTKQRSRLGEGGLGLDERQVAQFVQRATGSYSLLVDKQLQVLGARDANV